MLLASRRIPSTRQCRSMPAKSRCLTPCARQGIVLTTSVATSSMYMGFNWLDPVVGGADPKTAERARKLRHAISIAIDQEEFISIFQNGRGIAAQGPIPPGIFGHREGAAGINRSVYDWVDGQPRRKPVALRRGACWPKPVGPTGAMPQTGEPLVINLDTTPPVSAPRRASTGSTSSSPRSTCSWWCAAPTTTAFRKRCARARCSSSTGAGTPTIPTRRTSCSCCTAAGQGQAERRERGELRQQRV
jgi:hypothetical protein